MVGYRINGGIVTMDEFVLGSGPATIRFTGVLLAATSSRWGDAPRWVEVSIFAVDEKVQLPSGRWLQAGFVVETVGRSTVAGEVDRQWAQVCDTPAGVALQLRNKSRELRGGKRGMSRVCREALEVAWPDPDPGLAELLLYGLAG